MNYTIKSIEVKMHDGSFSGIRYKLRVEFDCRIPKKDLGHTVLDTGNALYREHSFPYTHCPSVEYETPQGATSRRKKNTVFYYFFNDVETAYRLGLQLSIAEIIQHRWKQDEMIKAGWATAYKPPYLYPIR